MYAPNSNNGNGKGKNNENGHGKGKNNAISWMKVSTIFFACKWLDNSYLLNWKVFMNLYDNNLVLYYQEKNKNKNK